MTRRFGVRRSRPRDCDSTDGRRLGLAWSPILAGLYVSVPVLSDARCGELNMWRAATSVVQMTELTITSLSDSVTGIPDSDGLVPGPAVRGPAIPASKKLKTWSALDGPRACGSTLEARPTQQTKFPPPARATTQLRPTACTAAAAVCMAHTNGSNPPLPPNRSSRALRWPERELPCRH